MPRHATSTARPARGTAAEDSLIETKANGRVKKPNFLAEFFRSPTSIGAIAPSGKQLCRKMVEMVDMPNVKVAVEYGPGTGPCTEQIIPALAPGAKFFAVELNERLAAACRRRCPTAKVHVRSATEISEICVEEGLAAENCVDAVFSCVPWASFPEKLQNEILSATMRVLKPGGVMVAFGYHVGLVTPAGRRFAKLLKKTFRTVERSGPILINLPTAFVYRCVK